jgi:NAD(P)-dependent dehydrogenase (short-subunit alcohol dehydrogenase family)
MGDLGSVPNITLLALDVTSRESLLAAHAQISKETDGKLDILYHNAGYRSLGMAVETSLVEALQCSSLASLEPGPDGRARASFIEGLARISLRGLPLGEIWCRCSRRSLLWPAFPQIMGK